MAGWLEVSGTTYKVDVYVKPDKVDYGCKPSPDLDQLPGDGRIWIDMNERARTLNVKNGYCISNDDKEKLQKILEDDNTMTVRMRKSVSTYAKLDGENETFTAGSGGYKGVKQIDYAGERWKFSSIKFLQAE